MRIHPHRLEGSEDVIRLYSSNLTLIVLTRDVGLDHCPCCITHHKVLCIATPIPSRTRGPGEGRLHGVPKAPSFRVAGESDVETICSSFRKMLALPSE